MTRTESADQLDQIAHSLLRQADALRSGSRGPITGDELALLDLGLAVVEGAIADLRGDEVAAALRVMLHAA